MLLKIIKYVIPAALLCCLPCLVFAESPISKVAQFHRCYHQLTGQRPANDHPAFARINSGLSSPLNECMTVLDKAMFQSTGAQKGMLTNIGDQEAVWALNQFYNFFKTWFSKFQGGIQANEHYVDVTEPALVLTRAMFQPGVTYDDVVLGNRSYLGARSDGYAYVNISVMNSNHTNAYYPGSVQNGLLHGVVEHYKPAGFTGDLNKTFVKQDGSLIEYFTSSFGNPNCPRMASLTDAQKSDPEYLKSINSSCVSYRSYGGGILGLQSFIANTKSFNDDDIAFSNGGIQAQRVWAQEALTSLLCREAPYLRGSDVAAQVLEYNSAYPMNADYALPFRQNTICMGCHGSLDTLAAAGRRIRFPKLTSAAYTVTGPKGGNPANPIMTTPLSFASIQVTKVLQPREALGIHMIHSQAGAPGYVKDFWARPANGLLTYRDYKGDLILENIIDPEDAAGMGVMNEIGRAFAKQDDLYVCAAKRFFHYFSGIDVPLQDPGTKSYSESDAYYRDLVIRLGLQFKQHKNLRTLVLQIMNLDLNTRASMRDTDRRESLK